MEQTVERKLIRVYCIQMCHDARQIDAAWPPVIRIRADVMCEIHEKKMEFKRDGQLVGRVDGNIKAWWIEEA